jgi:hypothetical protein
MAHFPLPTVNPNRPTTKLAAAIESEFTTNVIGMLCDVLHAPTPKNVMVPE